MNCKEYNMAVDLYSDDLFRFSIKLLKDRDLCKDCLQEAFFNLWKNRQNVDNKKVKSYLFTSIYHICLNQIRSKKQNSAIDFDISDSRISDYSNYKEVLNQALEMLPIEYKSILLLRDFQDYSYKEIAQITSESLANVKVMIFRARVFLKKCLEKQNILKLEDVL